MPIYEYQCNSCGYEESSLEKMDAPQRKKCPQCGKARAFVRLVSAAGFKLKGQGWYETDFKNPKRPGKGDGADKKDGDGKDAKGGGDGAKGDGDGKDAKGGGAKSDGKKADSAKSGDGDGKKSSGGDKAKGGK